MNIDDRRTRCRDQQGRFISRNDVRDADRLNRTQVRRNEPTDIGQTYTGFERRLIDFDLDLNED